MAKNHYQMLKYNNKYNLNQNQLLNNNNNKKKFKKRNKKKYKRNHNNNKFINNQFKTFQSNVNN